MKSGYHGRDSMREQAERMFKDAFAMGETRHSELRGAHAPKGHKLHGLNREQTDLHLPRETTGPRNTMNIESVKETMNLRKGGHAHHKHHAKRRAEGGDVVEDRAEGGEVENKYAGGGYAKGGEADEGLRCGGAPRSKMAHHMHRHHPKRRAEGGEAGEALPQKKAIGGGIIGSALGGYGGQKAGSALGNLIGGREGADIGGRIGSGAGSFLGGFGGGLLPFKKGGKVSPDRREAMHKREEHALSAVRHGIAAERRMDKTHAHRKAGGGGVYEREMVGEHPSHTPHHYNYEAEMKGEHKMGGKQKLAAGGVAKIRHEQSDSQGMPAAHYPRPRGTEPRGGRGHR